MEEDDNILVDLSNYYCKKCNSFPIDSKIYKCMSLISGTHRCGYFYCSQCLNIIEKCMNEQCNGQKFNIREDKALSRLFANGVKLDSCNFCKAFFRKIIFQNVTKHFINVSFALFKLKIWMSFGIIW